ncbi:hypothetical protein [Acinetobacter baumannii]|uniref:hypothetical protein n=1 Tax=Acinetobacter baumannii TaxID=470 RepID=UPI0036700A70
MKFNIKGVQPPVQSNKFPALVQSIPQEGDNPEDVFIIWALDKSQGVIVKNTEEPESEGELEVDYNFTDTKAWVRLPVGTVLEITQE